MRQSSDHYEDSAEQAMRHAADHKGEDAFWHLQAAGVCATLALAAAIAEQTEAEAKGGEQ